MRSATSPLSSTLKLDTETQQLFRRNTLKLPLKSISLAYRLEKERLMFGLRTSSDPGVHNLSAQVCTCRKYQQIVGPQQLGGLALDGNVWCSTPNARL